MKAGEPAGTWPARAGSWGLTWASGDLCRAIGLEMVIGLLGILKAGGAYVLLDPSYPSERLGYMLADSQPVLLLVDDCPAAAWRTDLIRTADQPETR